MYCTKISYKLFIAGTLMLIAAFIIALLSFFNPKNQKITNDKNQNIFHEIITRLNLNSNNVELKNITIPKIDSIVTKLNPSSDKIYFGIQSSKTDEFIIQSKEVNINELKSSPLFYSFEDSKKNAYTFFFLPTKENIFASNNHFDLISIILIIFAISCIFITIVSLYRIKSDKTLGNDFIYNMTHDFKTPIATISIANDLLNKIDIPEKKEIISRYTSIIKEETNRLRSMVEHILQITILNEGNISLTKENENLNSTIEGIVKSFELIIKGKNGCINFEPESLPYEVNCDKALMSNVISNLVDNAIKYSLETPEIYIRTIKQNNLIQIEVQDNGIGIEEKYLSQIFKKSVRLNTINRKGFGIGLYYVKTIVDAHDGTIEVNSTPGKGSSFIINLPLNNN
ncbi:MAG: HAMP domain-containing sensor histidine kinase [Bacteroidota bacterium]